MNIYKRILEEKGKLYCLAPMEGVTDTVFRQVLCGIGKPDLFFTEFMNTDGYMSKGRDRVSHRIGFDEIERPVVFQLWGNNPDNYALTVKDIIKFKPDGIDINVGCSVRNVINSGSCSALIKEPSLVAEIIKAVRSESKGIPISVKTRLGYDEVITDEWLSFLLEQELDLITVHGRISKDGYDVNANWEEIAKVVNLRDSLSPNTVILGNGDVQDLDTADDYISKYHVDGVMIARGIMTNPWLFSRRDRISKKERLEVLKKHLELFRSVWWDSKPFNTQKKYIKMYISNFDGANDLRMKLMSCLNISEVFKILED